MMFTQHKDFLIARPLVLLVAAMSLLLPAGWAWADDAASDGQESDGMGEQVAAWALTVPYIMGKGAFALGGAVVGSLGYVFSGLSYNTANAVWTPSINGTYIIRPAHLRGDEAVRFVGEGHEHHDESTPPLDQSASESVPPPGESTSEPVTR